MRQYLAQVYFTDFIIPIQVPFFTKRLHFVYETSQGPALSQIMDAVLDSFPPLTILELS